MVFILTLNFLLVSSSAKSNLVSSSSLFLFFLSSSSYIQLCLRFLQSLLLLLLYLDLIQIIISLRLTNLQASLTPSSSSLFKAVNRRSSIQPQKHRDLGLSAWRLRGSLTHRLELNHSLKKVLF